MNQEKIGKFIALRRKEKNFTQEQLAEKLSVSKNAVSKWERGLNLPDVSLMEELCKLLDISLNELFAGEILNAKQIKNQSENNLLNILKSNNQKYKKYQIILFSIITISIIITIILGRLLFIRLGFIQDSNLKYTQIYLNDESNIKGNVDINMFGKINIDFDIGANKYGYAVFKNPSKAMQRLKKDYAKGIKLIQKEYHLWPLSNFNFKTYGNYGWQVTSGTKEEREQAKFVSIFMDIYENSFN